MRAGKKGPVIRTAREYMIALNPMAITDVPRCSSTMDVRGTMRPMLKPTAPALIMTGSNRREKTVSEDCTSGFIKSVFRCQVMC
jgi:hypothetical protein